MGAWRREQNQATPREERKGFSKDVRFELDLRGQSRGC